MENLAIPEGYQRVMPYLIINNATAFFYFMQKVFEATEKIKIMRDDAHIRHAELQIGERVPLCLLTVMKSLSLKLQVYLCTYKMQTKHTTQHLRKVQPLLWQCRTRIMAEAVE